MIEFVSVSAWNATLLPKHHFIHFFLLIFVYMFIYFLSEGQILLLLHVYGSLSFFLQWVIVQSHTTINDCQVSFVGNAQISCFLFGDFLIFRRRRVILAIAKSKTTKVLKQIDCCKRYASFQLIYSVTLITKVQCDVRSRKLGIQIYTCNAPNSCDFK